MKNFTQLLLAVLTIAVLPSGKANAAPDIGAGIGELQYLLSNGYAQSALAKEGCSCVFVTRIPFQECLDRSNIPKALLAMMNVSIDSATDTVTVNSIVPPYFTPVRAQLDIAHPRFGCRILPHSAQ